MSTPALIELVNRLTSEPGENEWIEFKLNFHSPEEIGERISALANGACIHNQPLGYLVFGVEDQTHRIAGTTFKIKSHTKGSESLEHWLLTRLNPRIDFRTYKFEYAPGVHVSMLIIPAACNTPVSFLHTPYIRIGSITRKLHDYPEKEAKIWHSRSALRFELEVAKYNASAQEVIQLLSTEIYFDLLKIPYPQTQEGGDREVCLGETDCQRRPWVSHLQPGGVAAGKRP